MSFLKAGAAKIGEINTKYHVTEKISDAASKTATAVKDTNNKYHITENIGRTVSTSLDAATTAMGGSKDAAGAVVGTPAPPGPSTK